jgi:hypothetical protein
MFRGLLPTEFHRFLHTLFPDFFENIGLYRINSVLNCVCCFFPFANKYGELKCFVRTPFFGFMCEVLTIFLLSINA